MIREINTTAASDVMKKIESDAILKLYHTYITPSFLNNAYSWCLTDLEVSELDKFAYQNVFSTFHIRHQTWPSYTHLVYTVLLNKKTPKNDNVLYKVLQRSDDHWTKTMLYHLKTKNTGWEKHIQAPPWH